MTKNITIIPGDGIGPDITQATLKVLDALQIGLTYEFAEAGQTALDNSGDLLPQKTLDLILKNKTALKGPLSTPIGEGFKSVNVTLRQKFNLFANVRPIVSFAGIKSRYQNIDLVVIRENTEGLYSGEGQKILADGERAEATSVVTRAGAENIISFAFNTAQHLKRKKVTIVHKANILKSTSGLFLKVGRDVAKKFPTIQMQEMIVDNACMQLVIKPEQFDVIVTTNLFGDILSDLCAGLIGGLGLAPGSNIGTDCSIFEAVHGSAPDIAGKNIANPTALILASCLMLEHMNYVAEAQKIRKAIAKTILDNDNLTPDLGGNGSTQSFAQAVIQRL